MYFNNYLYACISVCGCVHVTEDGHRSQRLSIARGLELKVFVSTDSGAGNCTLGTSARGACTFNY